MLTAQQKRQYIRALITGKVSHGQFVNQPERTFKRVSKIIESELHGEEIVVAPDTVFVGVHDEIQYSYQEIEKISDGKILWCSLCTSSEYVAVESITITEISAEEQVLNFLNNN